MKAPGIGMVERLDRLSNSRLELSVREDGTLAGLNSRQKQPGIGLPGSSGGSVGRQEPPGRWSWDGQPNAWPVLCGAALVEEPARTPGT
jgi:hypothetical protein